jgi:hypothetical protein
MLPESGEEMGCLLPKTKKEVQEFLGAARFCCIWKPGYSSLAKPLYEATTGSRKDPLNWGLDQEKAFQEMKGLLTSAPALGLPDVTRPFNLFARKITHPWGSSFKQWTMAVASGLPVKMLRHSGLRVASMSPSNVTREADKLTLGQDINVKVPHTVMALINGQDHKWLTSSTMALYQGLCENP